MSRRTPLLVALAVITAACGSTPSAPTNADTITGTERFGWDQPATDASELASFRYAFYVDDARSDAADVSCATVASSGRFACSARLPEMSTGSHALQVAAFIVDAGTVRESSRSASVRVVKR